MACNKQIIIVEDSREQTPLSFDGFRGVDSMRSGLKTGDYSIQGYEDQICFERKSIPDLISTLSAGHERFLREIERMKTYEESYILIEHTASIACHYCDRHGWTAKYDTAIQSLFAYAFHCPLRVVFCKNREYMAKYIVKKSREFLKKKGENNGPDKTKSQTD